MTFEIFIFKFTHETVYTAIAFQWILEISITFIQFFDTVYYFINTRNDVAEIFKCHNNL